MSRALRSAPWLYAGLAAALAPLVMLGGDATSIVWRTCVVLAGVGAAIIGWRVRRMPIVFSIAFLLAAARLASEALGESAGGAEALSFLPVFADIAVGIVLMVALGLVVQQRVGALQGRDIVDILSATIGAGLVAWIIVASPLVSEFDVGVGIAIAAAAYLCVSALLLIFTLDLLFTGLAHNRTMRLFVGAASINLAATLLGCLRLVEVVPASTRSVAIALFTAAFALLCAGLTHSDAPAILESRGIQHDHRPHTPARLVLMIAGFVAPATLIAAVAPTTTLDVTVRTVGTLALVITIVVRLVIAMQDNGKARLALLHQLHRDDLTNLPTRWRFIESVEELLEATWRSDQLPTILQINLDRFKNINDSLGHNDANRVLVIIAERLVTAADSFDGLVARAGGDHFVVADGSTTSPQEAMARAEAIRHALSAPILIGESSLFVGASIGVAIAPRSRTVPAEELMRRADIATHRAKADGRNRVALFDDSMQSHLAWRMDVEHALHGAIGRQEMRLVHQPIVDTATGTVSGFEALIRWQRTNGTLVPPGDFIPIAEETGVINDLGAWALNDALRELRGWINDGVVPPTTTISVNVSPRQIADPNFADIVRNALDNSGVSPHLLWIEMTESMMLEEPDKARTTLRQIRAMGVRLALDDFGTGYSSLSLLQQFPIQRIKIDRAFVQGIADRSNDRSLCRTIIAMAQSMGLDIVAEGVETVHQLRSLQELECDKSQGFLISHPVPADAMRSTMAALGELADLSLFAPTKGNLASQESQPPVDDEAFRLFGGLGNPTKRPLGQPHV